MRKTTDRVAKTIQKDVTMHRSLLPNVTKLVTYYSVSAVPVDCKDKHPIAVWKLCLVCVSRPMRRMFSMNECTPPFFIQFPFLQIQLLQLHNESFNESDRSPLSKRLVDYDSGWLVLS